MGSYTLVEYRHRAVIDWSAAEADLAELSPIDRLEAIDAGITVFFQVSKTMVYAAQGTSWVDSCREGRFVISFEAFPDRFAVIGVNIASPLDDLPLGGFVIRRGSHLRVMRFRGRRGDPASYLPGSPGSERGVDRLDLLDEDARIASLRLPCAKATAAGDALSGALAAAIGKIAVRASRSVDPGKAALMFDAAGINGGIPPGGRLAGAGVIDSAFLSVRDGPVVRGITSGADDNVRTASRVAYNIGVTVDGHGNTDTGGGDNGGVIVAGCTACDPFGHPKAGAASDRSDLLAGCCSQVFVGGVTFDLIGADNRPSP